MYRVRVRTNASRTASCARTVRWAAEVGCVARYEYRELGGDYFDRMSTDRLTRYHTRRLAALGYAVTLTPRAA